MDIDRGHFPPSPLSPRRPPQKPSLARVKNLSWKKLLSSLNVYSKQLLYSFILHILLDTEKCFRKYNEIKKWGEGDCCTCQIQRKSCSSSASGKLIISISRDTLAAKVDNLAFFVIFKPVHIVKAY